jgi:acyl carrier protein
MSTPEIHNRLETVFQNVFNDDTLHIFPEMTAADVEDWDSMQHINLIVACEKQFQVKFALSEISELKNVGELENLIARKIG